ncbi:MAG: hypothetical protein KF795_16000 [Labilithrix sp.]|nr:hypothetical protein [Labilithrix sp.]
MRRALFLFVLSAVGLALACESSSETNPEPDGDGIHPQPQPNRRAATFTAPCTATGCGEAPESLTSPKCKPLPAECGWTDEGSVSFRPCDESECGVAPGSEVCPEGTLFRGNTCGSENEAACAWNTACAPPRSTTPCADPAGCGPMPAIGVICEDGGNGELACMKLDTRCDWQRTCD